MFVFFKCLYMLRELLWNKILCYLAWIVFTVSMNMHEQRLLCFHLHSEDFHVYHTLPNKYPYGHFHSFCWLDLLATDLKSCLSFCHFLIISICIYQPKLYVKSVENGTARDFKHLQELTFLIINFRIEFHKNEMHNIEQIYLWPHFL